MYSTTDIFKRVDFSYKASTCAVNSSTSALIYIMVVEIRNTILPPSHAVFTSLKDTANSHFKIKNFSVKFSCFISENESRKLNV
jgi:hypothetical protein